MSVKYEDYSINVTAAIDESIVDVLSEVSGEIVSQIKRNFDTTGRVDSGETKNSYEYHISGNSVAGEYTSTIGSDHENAIWEEYGTGEYALHGDGRKGGWVYCDSNGNFHKTLGKTPSRCFHNAFTVLKPKVLKRLQDALKGV